MGEVRQKLRCLVGKHMWELDDDDILKRECIHCHKRQKKFPPWLQYLTGKSFGHSAWKWKTIK